MARVSGKKKAVSVALNATDIWAPQAGPQLMATLCPARIILFGGSRGGGKMLSNDSKILTPKGWKTHGEIKVGDVITDPETGGAQRVIGVYPQGELDLYRVTFDDGASVLAGLEHLWIYKLPNRNRPRSKPSAQRNFVGAQFGESFESSGRYANFRVDTTEQMRGALLSGSAPRIPLCSPVLFDVNGRTGTTGLDPYLIGQMLGDGNFSLGKTELGGFRMTTADEETQAYLSGLGFRQSGTRPIEWYLSYRCSDTWSLLRSWAANHKLLSKTGKDKFIPKYVFTANVEYRLAVLQGLLDSDGYVDDRGHIEFSNVSDDLCFGVADLVRSFGGKATVSEPITGKYVGKDGEIVECQTYRRVYIWSKFASRFFRLRRKSERCTDSWNGGYENMRKVTSIEFSHKGLATCIKVSSPHGLYIADDYIVTHNTDCAIGKQVYGALRYGADWNGLFIRKSYKYFADIRRRLNQMIRAGLPAELIGPQQGTNYLRFENGANVTLTVVESIEKAEFFQGQSFSSISIEEACQFSYIDAMIEMLKGCMRSAAGVPTSMFLTANPGGPGHSSVKARFMPMGVKPGQIVKDDSGMTMVFIPSRVEDNKILCDNDPEYVNLLRSIKDPALRRAWLEGDWDVVLGGFFGDVWNHFRHVVPSFKPPMHWPRIVGMDWGSATPFSIGWYCVADGETSVMLSGVPRIFPKGALIRFHEWYGCPKNAVTGRIEANVGLRLQSSDVAIRMVDMEQRMPWLLGRTTSVDRVADPSIFAEKDGPSVAEKFAECGVVWRRAENRRISGWDSVRKVLNGRIISQEWGEDENGERILLAEEREPMLYFTDNNEHMIRTLPEQERDAVDFEDVDCFVSGTLIETSSGMVKIEDIVVGDMVATPIGLRPVTRSFCSGEFETYRVDFTDGTSLEGIGSHKVMTNSGLLPLCLIGPDTVIEKHKGENLCQTNQWFIEGFGLHEEAVEDIGSAIRKLLPSMVSVLASFTDLSIQTYMERLQRICTSTTLTEIQITTIFQIWNSLIRTSMLDCTSKSELKPVQIQRIHLRLLPGGALKKGGLSFAKMLGLCTKILPRENLRALIVASLLELNIHRNTCAVNVVRSEKTHEKATDTLSTFAKYVDAHTQGTESQGQKWATPVVTNVGGSYVVGGKKPVYSLEVNQSRLYYANNVLVSNTSGEDHACLALNTKVFFNGEDIAIGDVLGQNGAIVNLNGFIDMAYSCSVTRESAPIMRLEMEDGEEVFCTPDHRFFAKNGWTRCDMLTSDDELRYVDLSQNKERMSWKVIKNLKGLGTIYADGTTRTRGRGCTGLSGNRSMDQSLKDSMFTTKMRTGQIIELKTSSCCLSLSTIHCTQASQTASKHRGKLCLMLRKKPLPNGTDQKRVWLGIKGSMKSTARARCTSGKRAGVIFVEKYFPNSLGTSRMDMGTSVPISAKPLHEEPLGLITKSAHAVSVESCSQSTNTQRQKHATAKSADSQQEERLYWKKVKSTSMTSRRETVACIYAPITHSFALSSGLISHNCDELRYVVTSRPSAGITLSSITRPAPMTACEIDFAQAEAGVFGNGVMDELSIPRSSDMGVPGEEVGYLNVHIAK